MIPRQQKITAFENKVGRWPSAAMIGALLGDMFWALAVTGHHVTELLEDWGPLWLSGGVYGLFRILCIFIAWPIAAGGYFFVWGDNGPPPDSWISNSAFNLCFGLVAYAIIGAVVGVLTARKYAWQISVRTLVIAFAIVVLAVGLTAALKEL